MLLTLRLRSAVMFWVAHLLQLSSKKSTTPYTACVYVLSMSSNVLF